MTARNAMLMPPEPPYLERSVLRKNVLNEHEMRNRVSIDRWYQKRDEYYYHRIELVDLRPKPENPYASCSGRFDDTQ